MSNIINNENKNSTFLPNDKDFLAVPEFTTSIEEAKARVTMLQTFVKEMMIPDVDYGIVPGSKKPSLLKPGAEKLCEVYGFSKQIDVIHRLEDWEKGIFHYEVKATLINKRTGLLEAEGVGSCNSKEKKYKNQDGFTLANTILKMAKKRALIDAVLSATRSSSIFTQDIESTHENIQTVKQNEVAVRRKELYDLVKSKQLDSTTVKNMIKERYNLLSSKELTLEQMEELVTCLKKDE